MIVLFNEIVEQKIKESRVDLAVLEPVFKNCITLSKTGDEKLQQRLKQKIDNVLDQLDSNGRQAETDRQSIKVNLQESLNQINDGRKTDYERLDRQLLHLFEQASTELTALQDAQIKRLFTVDKRFNTLLKTRATKKQQVRLREDFRHRILVTEGQLIERFDKLKQSIPKPIIVKGGDNIIVITRLRKDSIEYVIHQDKIQTGSVIAMGSGVGLLRQELKDGLLDDRYVDVVGDVMTGTLQIDVPTATKEALTLRSTDDDNTNPLLRAITNAGLLKTQLDPDGSFRVGGDFENYDPTLPNMGKEQKSDLRGLCLTYITNKLIANCRIGGNHNTENGSIRVNVFEDPDTFEIYLRDAWQTIIYDLTTEDGDFRHAPVSEEIYVWRGDSVATGLNGQPITQEYETSMGAYPSYRVLNGGTF